MEDAKTPGDFKDACNEFQQAATLAPWLANAYRNLAIAQDKAGMYDEALGSIRFYLLTKPSTTDVNWAEDLKAKVEYRKEKAARAKYEPAAQPVVPQENSFEALLRKIDQRNYRGNGEVITVYGRHIAWCGTDRADRFGGSCPEYGNVTGLGGGCDPIEINGYESTCGGSYDTGKDYYWNDHFRVTISNDGETIMIHWRRINTSRSAGTQPPYDSDFTLHWFR